MSDDDKTVMGRDIYACEVGQIEWRGSRTLFVGWLKAVADGQALFMFMSGLGFAAKRFSAFFLAQKPYTDRSSRRLPFLMLISS